jgi:hypothetical protein
MIRCSTWLALMLFAASCADETPVSAVSMPAPRALTRCNQVPANLRAELWTSGVDEPCALEVDLVAGTTTGTCDAVPTGTTRVFTVDWFVLDAGVRVVLAQASQSIDLRNAQEATALRITDDDIITTDCVDATVDNAAGLRPANVVINGTARPVCDLDDDGTANILEVCSGISAWEDG